MERKPRQIRRIRTHEFFHADEAIAIFILRKYGERLFPGISRARVIFERAEGDATGNPEDHAEYDLLLGTGKGSFDEHDIDGMKSYECCATLVASYLGVRKNPELKQMLDYALANDRDGTSSPSDLAHTLRGLHNRPGSSQWDTLQKALFLLEVWWEDQCNFHIHAARVFAGADRRTFIRNGREMRVAIMSTDNCSAATYSLYRGADVVIVRNGRGHTQILKNRKSLGDAHLDNVSRILRIGEQRKSGNGMMVSDWETLGHEGMLLRWHFQKEANHQALLNGSKTATNVEPSQLSLDEVFEAVTLGLTDGWQEFKREFESGQQRAAC